MADHSSSNQKLTRKILSTSSRTIKKKDHLCSNYRSFIHDSKSKIKTILQKANRASNVIENNDQRFMSNDLYVEKKVTMKKNEKSNNDLKISRLHNILNTVALIYSAIDIVHA